MPVNKQLALPVAAMVVVVVVSNIMVQYPINDWLTYGALTYPVAFFVTDLTNRAFGPAQARRVVRWGFFCAVVLSAWVATPRIAFASGSAFLVAQLLDVFVFNRLRKESWWKAPLASSVIGSAIDTTLFFSLAFAGSGLPWLTWAYGDFAVKIGMALLMLAPYGGIVRRRFAGV
ncbi:queuosine precursor transporter [Oleispirillum naphthae]|uniref:queuosine precursor transporter n=1 Tax=Oleispirillum naphthae TaxID=2838853 RepID=UPI00308256DB